MGVEEMICKGLSNWCDFLMHRKWEVEIEKQLAIVEIKITNDECKEGGFLMRMSIGRSEWVLLMQ